MGAEDEIEAILSGSWIAPPLPKTEIEEHLKRTFGSAVSDAGYDPNTGTVTLTLTQPFTFLSASISLPEGALTDEDLEDLNKEDDSHEPAPAKDF